ncbi:hypothetical protein KQY30_18020 [Streptomyces sp. GMY02]|uniref:hypothetical protein n=1 Tax=Streptomyces sp. GMY02 TaxID=1333528 RepID=UPI001C2C9E05|nr:hypothetical protein [Streptomyces sp. GMY02]QXE35877.1 hypothetical protein KQY30_18020 [Streptomyces sp. GMY02]
MSARLVRAGAAPRLLRAAVFTAVCVVLSATGHVLAACAPVPWWTLLLGFVAVFAVAAPLAGRVRSTGSIVVALTAGQLGLHSLFGIGQRHPVVPAGTDDALIRLAAKLVCGAGPASLSAVDAQRIVANAGLNPAGSGASAGTGSDVMAGAHQHMAGMGVLSGSMPSGSASASVHASVEGLLPSLPMVLAHLLAALATGWLLRRGDLALVRLTQLSAQGVGEVTDSAALRALRAALALVRALRAGLPGVPASAVRAPRTSYLTPPVTSGETLQHSVIRRGPPAVLALAA